MAHKNPSGLHNRVNAVLVNSRKEGKRITGVLIGMNENTYGELLEAYDYICEIGYVPETFWKHHDLYESFRNVCIDEWNKIFRAPYLGVSMVAVFPWKLYTRHLKNRFEQLLKHYASEYFVQTIAYWMQEGWVIQESDLYSSYPVLEKMGVEIAKQPWIEKYNKSVTGENNEE